MSFGYDVVNYVVSNLNTYTVTVYQALATSWPGQSFTALYLAIGGYMIISGHAGKHAKEMATSILFLVIIQGIVSTGFTEWIAAPILDTTWKLSQLAVSATGGDTDIFFALDDGLAKVMTAIDRLEPVGNLLTSAWLYLKVGFASLVLSIAYGLLYLAFLVLYISAIFGIYMMLMVGGIFLWLASFKATRHYTVAWFRAILNYLIWAFFLSAIMGFFMSVITAGVTDISKWDIAVEGPFPASLGKLVFMCLLCAYMLTKAADFAAQLTGGTSMQPGIVTTGAGLVASSTSRAVSAATGSQAARTAGRAVGAAVVGGVGGAAVRAYSALRGVK